MPKACDVTVCPRDAVLKVLFPQSGRYDYCDRHARPHLQYAEPLDEPEGFAEPDF